MGSVAGTCPNEGQHRLDFDDVIALAGEKVIFSPDATPHMKQRRTIPGGNRRVDGLRQNRVHADGPDATAPR